MRIVLSSASLQHDLPVCFIQASSLDHESIGRQISGGGSKKKTIVHQTAYKHADLLKAKQIEEKQ